MRNYKSLKSASKQAGLTLLEFLLVIGLVAVVIGVGIVIFTQSQSGSNSYKASNSVLTLSSAIKGLYPTANFATLTPVVIIDSKKVPDTMINGTTLVNPWGQTVAVGPVTPTGGAADSAFSVTFPGVPTNECNSILAAVNSNFQKITVGTTAVKDDTAATPVKYDAATAVTACKPAVNSIVFQGT